MTDPVSLVEWGRANPPAEDLYGRHAWLDQLVFLRDELLYAVCATSEDARGYRDGTYARVVSVHRSKSVLLPVVEIVHPVAPLRATLRGNFHDWKINIQSERPVAVDFGRLLDPTLTYSDCYCEGFPPDRIAGSYAANARRFVVEVRDEHAVWAFFHLLDAWARGGGVL